MIAPTASVGGLLVASGRPTRQRMTVMLIGSIVLLILVLPLFQTG